MQYPEFTSATVVQAWPEPGSLKSCGGHHLEPQGSRAYSSAVPRVISSRTFSPPRLCLNFQRLLLAHFAFGPGAKLAPTQHP